MEPSPDASIDQLLRKSLDFMANRDWEAAQGSFEAVLSRAPQHIQANVGLASALEMLGKRQYAIIPLRAAACLAPNDAKIRLHLANLLLNTGDYENAALAYRRVLTLDDKIGSAYSGLASALYRQGNGEEAILTLYRGIEHAPNEVGIHELLGHFLWKSPSGDKDPSKIPQALAAFESALTINPNHLGALRGLTAAYAEQREGQKALATLQRAILLAPGDPSLRVWLGNIFEMIRQFHDAADAYHAALSLDIDHVGAKNGLKRVRDPEAIFALFDRVLSENSDAADLQDIKTQLDISGQRLAELIAFVRNPKHSCIPFLADNPLDSALLGNILRLLAGEGRKVVSPDNRANIRIAGEELDILSDQKSHEDWSPIQWLNAYLLRRSASKRLCAAVVAMRDDGLTILEWLAHYRALGFDHIFVYSNDNADSSERLLSELANQGIITYVENRMGKRIGVNPQRKAFAHALNFLPELWDYEWVFFVDSDEFLIPSERYDFKISGLLDDLRQHFPNRLPTALCINWLWYVSGNKFSYEKGLLLRRFQHALSNSSMKSIVRIRDAFAMHGLHFPEFGPDGFLVGPDYGRLRKAWSWITNSDGGDGIIRAVLNHYWHKSFEEFSIKKWRGDTITGSSNFFLRGFDLFFKYNAQETEQNYRPTPERIVCRVEAEIDSLLSLPAIKECQEAIYEKLPSLIARFDRDGGLRAIYDRARGQVHAEDAAHAR